MSPPLDSAVPTWRQITRAEVVRLAACPTCSSPAGQPCQGRRGPRTSNHLARVELALEHHGSFPVVRSTTFTSASLR